MRTSSKWMTEVLKAALVAACLSGCGPSAAPSGAASNDAASTQGADQAQSRTAGRATPERPDRAAGDTTRQAPPAGSRAVVPAADAPARRDAAAAPRGLSLHIGVNAYRSIPALSLAVKDATDLADAFREMGFEATTLPDPGTKREIIDAVRQIARRAGPDDSIVITYSGHGWGERLPGDAGGFVDFDFLCPADYRDYRDAVGTRELRDILDESSAKGAAIVIDACRSGQRLQTLAQTRAFQEFTGSGSTKVLMYYGTQSGMVSIEASGSDRFGFVVENGLFTHFIRSAIRRRAGLDTDGDGVFSFEEMANNVATEMMSWSLRDTSRYQLPFWNEQLGRVQIPLAVVGKDSGSAILPGTVAFEIRQIVDGPVALYGSRLASYAADDRLGSDAVYTGEVFDALGEEIARLQDAAFADRGGRAESPAFQRLLTLIQAVLEIEKGSEAALAGLQRGGTNDELRAQMGVRLAVLEAVARFDAAQRPVSQEILGNLAASYARWLIDHGETEALARLAEPRTGSAWPGAIDALEVGLPRLWRSGRPELAARLYQRFLAAAPEMPMPPALFESNLGSAGGARDCGTTSELIAKALQGGSAYTDEERDMAQSAAIAWIDTALVPRAGSDRDAATCLRRLAGVGDGTLRGAILASLEASLVAESVSTRGSIDPARVVAIARAFEVVSGAKASISREDAQRLATASLGSWGEAPDEREVNLVRELASLARVEAADLVLAEFLDSASDRVVGTIERGASATERTTSAWLRAASALGLDEHAVRASIGEDVRRAVGERALAALEPADARAVLELATLAATIDPERSKVPLSPTAGGQLAGVLLSGWSDEPQTADLQSIEVLAGLCDVSPPVLVDPSFGDAARERLERSAERDPARAIAVGIAWGEAGRSLGLDDTTAFQPLLAQADRLADRCLESIGGLSERERGRQVEALLGLSSIKNGLSERLAEAFLARGADMLGAGTMPDAIREFRDAQRFGADAQRVDALLLPGDMFGSIAESDEALAVAARRLGEVADLGWESLGLDAGAERIVQFGVQNNKSWIIDTLAEYQRLIPTALRLAGEAGAGLLADMDGPGAYERFLLASDMRYRYADRARTAGAPFALTIGTLRSGIDGLIQSGPDIGQVHHAIQVYLSQAPRNNSEAAAMLRALLARCPADHGSAIPIAMEYVDVAPAGSYPSDVAARVVEALLYHQRWESALEWYEGAGEPAVAGDYANQMANLLWHRDWAASWERRPLNLMLLTPRGAEIKYLRVDCALVSMEGLRVRLAPISSRWDRASGQVVVRCELTGEIRPDGVHLDMCGEPLAIGMDQGGPIEAGHTIVCDALREDGWHLRINGTGVREVAFAIPPENTVLLSTFARTRASWRGNTPEEVGRLWDREQHFRVAGGRVAFDGINATANNRDQYSVGADLATKPAQLRGTLVATDELIEDMRRSIARGRGPQEVVIEVVADGRSIQSVRVTANQPEARIDVAVPQGTQTLAFRRVGGWPNQAFVLFTDLRLVGVE
ncbi:MAG: caspase family protein [Phycisphaerales bacterium]